MSMTAKWWLVCRVYYVCENAVGLTHNLRGAIFFVVLRLSEEKQKYLYLNTQRWNCQSLVLFIYYLGSVFKLKGPICPASTSTCGKLPLQSFQWLHWCAMPIRLTWRRILPNSLLQWKKAFFSLFRDNINWSLFAGSRAFTLPVCILNDKCIVTGLLHAIRGFLKILFVVIVTVWLNNFHFYHGIWPGTFALPVAFDTFNDYTCFFPMISSSAIFFAFENSVHIFVWIAFLYVWRSSKSSDPNFACLVVLVQLVK